MSHSQRLMLTGLFLGTMTWAARGEVLHDDFGGPQLDPTRWMVNLDIDRGPASVDQRNGHVELQNRGHLITRSQFDPLTGPLVVEGTWTLLQGLESFPGHDILAVLTRSDGVPGGGFSETNNGILFALNGNGFIGIQEAVNQEYTPLAQAPLLTEDGDVFRFRITDDGQNLTFGVQEIGGQGAGALVTAASSRDFALDHVVFHNREATHGSHIAYLDDVSIRHVPEPSAWIMMVVSLLICCALLRCERV